MTSETPKERRRRLAREREARRRETYRRTHHLNLNIHIPRPAVAHLRHLEASGLTHGQIVAAALALTARPESLFAEFCEVADEPDAPGMLAWIWREKLFSGELEPEG